MKKILDTLLYIIGIIMMVLHTIFLIGVAILVWVVIPYCLEDFGIKQGPLNLEDFYMFFR